METIELELKKQDLAFTSPPVVIGGRVMESYGIRRSGPDIDLVVTNEDYQELRRRFPQLQKDIYGDLGVTPGPFEIWRSIALLDYSFYQKDSTAQGALRMISFDRLLFTRVCAMDVQKYWDDLIMMKESIYERYRNPGFLEEANTHVRSYHRTGGTVPGGAYRD